MDTAAYLPRLLDGLAVSLQLTVISVFCGYLIGLLFALGGASVRPWLRWPTIVVIEIGRGIPALVVLYIAYYGLPSIGVLLENFVAAACALTFTVGAYSSETIRAGLQSVPVTQREASAALGLTTMTTFVSVILPQGMRSAVPALMGLGIQSFQGTSLAYSISVNELMSQSYQVSNTTFEYLQTYAVTGAIYIAIAVPATWLSMLVERRLARGHS
ncbi:amino acid ABC transporter permease [Clavibacter michiganensis]|nr:amino acid ABC transporter permease [Clavibacter michiganensis]